MLFSATALELYKIQLYAIIDAVVVGFDNLVGSLFSPFGQLPHTVQIAIFVPFTVAGREQGQAEGTKQCV